MNSPLQIQANRNIVIWGTGVDSRWFKNVWSHNHSSSNPVGAFIDDSPISYFQKNVDGIPVLGSTLLLQSYNNVERPFIFLPSNSSGQELQQILIQYGLQPNADFAVFPTPPDYTIDWLAFYPDWQSAQKDTVGYEDRINIDQHIVSGHAERKAKVSNKVSYADQRLFMPFVVINEACKEKLTVLDFGGGMGKHYLRFKHFLPARSVKWIVCETPSMAQAGQSHFTNSELQFISDVATLEMEVDVILVSSSIQYVDDSEAYYNKLNNLKPKFFLIDRTPLSPWPEDRILVQRVFRNTPQGAFETSYPSRFLSKSLWQQRFEKDYQILMKWPDTDDVVDVAGEHIVYSGLLLKRR